MLGLHINYRISTVQLILFSLVKTCSPVTFVNHQFTSIQQFTAYSLAISSNKFAAVAFVVCTVCEFLADRTVALLLHCCVRRRRSL